MSSLQVLSTCTVHHSYNSVINGETQTIPLTPTGLPFTLLGPIQKGLLFHKPNNQSTPLHLSFFHHLKTSLSRTLDFFPNLAGRMVRLDHEDDTVSFSVHCNNAGALFVHAIANGVTVSDIHKPLHTSTAIVRSFFTLNKTLNCDVTAPLLGVQVTELVDGIFIGCTINHSVADGTSFWNFFNSWSRISRDLHHVPRSPVFDFSCIDSGCFPIRIPISQFQKANADFVAPILGERVFHFKKEAISSLKAKANKEAGLFNKISSLQSLLALIWRAAIRASPHVNPKDEYTMSIAVGLRQRLNPPLPDEYFGNPILYTRTARVRAEELLERGLGFAAAQVNNVVTSHTEEKIRADMKKTMENPEIKAFEELVSNSIPISSSPRFDVYGNDFGWGKPAGVRSGGGNKFNWKFTLYPGVEEGGIDVEACVAPETMEGMEKDEEFMSTVSADN